MQIHACVENSLLGTGRVQALVDRKMTDGGI